MHALGQVAVNIVGFKPSALQYITACNPAQPPCAIPRKNLNSLKPPNLEALDPKP